MLLQRSSSLRRSPHPVILGTGLTGLAISRALAASGIVHVLVGTRPSAAPRLGESLNAEGSLEIARQFPDQAHFFFKKRRVALFFDGHAADFGALQLAAGRAMFAPLCYPATIDLLHVDRIGFDRAVFEAAIADDRCLFAESRPVSLDYDAATRRIDAVHLADGSAIASTYVFEASNHARFLGRKLGVGYRQIGGPRRVAFAHYHREGAHPEPPPWMEATSLLRLDARTDPVDGLAWCIPLGEYVSVGISVDPETTGANPALLLNWVEQAYARRGIGLRRSFARRGEPVDVHYEHYTHERCHGRNWLLAGPSCCQIWFPAAAGVASSLIAARLAPDILKAPAQVAPIYQEYLDRLVASHAGLEWMTEGDPWLIGTLGLRRRSRTMIDGNVRRLGRYFDLAGTPAELAFGDALRRLYEADRLLAGPLRIEEISPEAQATRLFATADADPWTGSEIVVPVPVRSRRLPGPRPILRVVDILSGRHPVAGSANLLAEDVELEIDGFQLRGVAQWVTWVDWLRESRRVAELRFAPKSLTESGDDWVLTGNWQGTRQGRRLVSPEFSMIFTVEHGRVTRIRTHRADHTFVTGDWVLRPVAFAAALSRLTPGEAI